MDWFQLWADVPLIGKQWVGWLWSETTRAQALNVSFGAQQAASQTGLPAISYYVLDKNGNPLGVPLPFPF